MEIARARRQRVIANEGNRDMLIRIDIDEERQRNQVHVNWNDENELQALLDQA